MKNGKNRNKITKINALSKNPTIEGLIELLTEKPMDSPIKNEENYFRFKRAVNLATSQSGWRLTILDDIDEPKSTHYVEITFDKTDLGKNEMNALSNILNLLDDGEFFVDAEGTVSLMLGIEVYSESL